MNIGEAIGSHPDPRLYKEDTGLISNSDGIGVEVELENINYFYHDNELPQIYGFWKTVEDGSLRDGTEFIFDGPLKGANITAALDVLSDFLDKYRKNGKPVQVSERCSVHIHLDVREIEEPQLINLILIYMFFERLLFHYINPTRSKNNYCRPLTDSVFKYTLNKLKSQNSSGYSLSSIIQFVKMECDKYSALNILPITKYGSVEFRHHHGTTNMSDVKDWINIILSIKIASRLTSIDQIIKLYEDSGSKSVVQHVFDNTPLGSSSYLDGVDDLEIFMHKGYTDIKEILDMKKLQELANNRKISRVKTENTLFYKFKEKRGMFKPVSIEDLGA
jgi:hypothetical protein